MSHKPLSFALGEHWIIDATVHTADGAPLDLTDAVAIEFRVASQAALVAKVTKGAGITVTDGPSGKCKIVVSPAEQTYPVAAVCTYQLMVGDADGILSEQSAGPFKITASLKAAYP